MAPAMPEGEVVTKSSPIPRRAAWVPIAVVVAIVVVGAALRFHAIGRKSLWLDEAATMSAVDASFGEVFRGVRDHDFHPPLYYLALHTWMQGSRDGVWARAFSATASVATLVVFYLLARVLLARTAAVVATAALAASAYHVYFAQEARNYALATLFVTVSWYCLAQLLTRELRRRWPWWAGVAAANAAALYTLYSAAFSLAAQLVLLLVLWRSVGRRLILDYVLWQLIPAAVFALWVPVVLDRFKELSRHEPPAGATLRSAEGVSETAAQFACGFLGQLSQAHGPVVRAASALACILVLALALRGLRHQRCATAVALAWLLCPVVLLAAVPIRGHPYEPKHLIVASPALALAAGVAVAAARGRLKSRVIALVAAIVVGNAISLGLYYSPKVEKADWRGAVQQFAERVQAGDMVTFTPPMDDLPFRYLYDRLGGPVVGWVQSPARTQPFRGGELKLAHKWRKSVWVLEGFSNVEKPNPLVLDMLRNPQKYGAPRFTCAFEWTHAGLVGTVRVWQFNRAAEEDARAAERREPR